MDYLRIIDKYYPEDNALRRLLLEHSQSVARKALQIVAFHPRLHLILIYVMASWAPP